MKTVAIVFVSYDGILNSYSGIGTSSRTFIKSFPAVRQELLNSGVDASLHLISPALVPDSLGYSESIKNESIQISKASGGSLRLIANAANGMIPYGGLENWKAASISAASEVLQIATEFDETYVFCLDTPFAHTPYYVDLQKKAFTENKIVSILYLQSDVFIHEPQNPSVERIGWESSAIHYCSRSKDAIIADVGTFMTNHLKKQYGLNDSDFIKLTMGLNPEDDRFATYSEEEIRSFLMKYDIPLNKNIIFSVARAVEYKGFDILIRAYSKMKEPAHLVFVASPYKTEATCVNQLKQIIKETGVKVTPVFDCDFELPKYICQWKNTKIVAQLARYEPFGLVPEEVRLWSKKQGPVVMASYRDGFVEQIQDEIDGFLVDIDDIDLVAKKLDKVISLSDTGSKDIRDQGLKTFNQKYDFRKTLHDCIYQLIFQSQKS